MSFAQKIEIVLIPILQENTVELFKNIIFGDKQASIVKVNTEAQANVFVQLILFCRMTPVMVKLFNISRLLSTFLPKRNVSFLRCR